MSALQARLSDIDDAARRVPQNIDAEQALKRRRKPFVRPQPPMVSAEGEEWRPIPSAPGYMASSHGRIRGRQRSIMRLRPGDHGYLRVALTVNDRPRSFNVNWLVCEAFHGPAPTPAHQAAHGDNVPTNNRPGNLRWATPKENQADRKIHGTRLFGERHAMAKLSDQQAEQIRQVYAAGKSGTRVRMGLRAELAERFGVRPETITAIGNLTRRTVTE